MNWVWFSFILLLSILNDYCTSSEDKMAFGGIIARDCNMIKPPNEQCKPKEVIPILAREYYRLYYFKMVCNAVNLGDNIIAVPTLCFETGVPAPGEFVAVGSAHNWCHDAPEYVANNFMSINRKNASITFIRLLPPMPEPCHPVKISDPASEPRMMKGFNWNSRKTFDKRDSYGRCIPSVPSALLYSRPNEFWGFQHPNCKDPIPIKEYFEELNRLVSSRGVQTATSTQDIFSSEQGPAPTTPATKFSGNDTADLENLEQRLEESEAELDKLKHDNEMLNHTVEYLKTHIEDDEEKIHDLENNVDQDRKHIKDDIEEIREQEQSNQQWIEDLEKNIINDEEKLKELEDAIKQSNQNSVQYNETIEDLKQRVEDDENKMSDLHQNLIDENGEIDEIESDIDELHAELYEENQKIDHVQKNITNQSNETNKQINDIIEELKSQVETDENNIQHLEDVVNAANQSNQELDNKIEELKEQLDADEKKIDELENIVEITQKNSNKNGILTNNECENFVQPSNCCIENIQSFIENVNDTLKNNAEEIEQFKEFMKTSQIEITHLEQIVRELVDTFFDNMNNWSKFKIEIDEKLDSVIRSNEQLQEFVVKTNNTLKHLSKYLNY
ncbi:unnamed protein product [Phyllotreta striolata]|uniref:Uncharacterized protein n=1 Tax=Phyllotreta striolata TaxID=444603 RepID=A0A9N9TQU8_PHYSR|nr:unnamed protein product [Phyllotreta striolata]